MDRIQENQKKATNLCELYADGNDDDSEKEQQDRGLDAQFLLRSTPEDVEKYMIHVRKQLMEGEGECLVELGAPINSNSKNPKSGLSEEDLDKAADAQLKILEKIPAVGTKVIRRKQTGGGSLFTEVWIIRDPPTEKDFIEARVAVVGNVDAGKSTLLGVLTHSALDDGRGAARTKLFRHKHEFESGRTSSGEIR